jgi:hypothetical protein
VWKPAKSNITRQPPMNNETTCNGYKVSPWFSATHNIKSDFWLIFCMTRRIRIDLIQYQLPTVNFHRDICVHYKSQLKGYNHKPSITAVYWQYLQPCTELHHVETVKKCSHSAMEVSQLSLLLTIMLYGDKSQKKN